MGKNLTIRMMDRGQVMGLKLSIQRGKELAREHPEIADGYRHGKTLDQLARKYSNDYDISDRVAVVSIYYALKELIPKDELRGISAQHIIAGRNKGGAVTGARMLKEGLGIWAPENEKKLDEARKKGGRIGGSVAGTLLYEEGRGIFALSKSDLHNQGIRAAIARGEVPYEARKRRTESGLVSEKEYVIYLKSQNLRWGKIARMVNRVFGNNRKFGSIRTLYNSRWKKQKQG